MRFFLFVTLLVSLALLVLAKRERFTSTKAMQSKVPKALSAACKGNFELARSLVKLENSKLRSAVDSSLCVVVITLPLYH